jgi:hypothetical protein
MTKRVNGSAFATLHHGAQFHQQTLPLLPWLQTSPSLFAAPAQYQTSWLEHTIRDD